MRILGGSGVTKGQNILESAVGIFNGQVEVLGILGSIGRSLLAAQQGALGKSVRIGP